MHSRVRMAVFPARNIDVPNCINTSIASFAAAEAAPAFALSDEVTISSERSLPFVRGAAARRSRTA